MHIHTEYCGHAPGMTVGAILKRADEIELETIAITDHIFRAEDMLVTNLIAEELDRFKPKCRVVIGAEVDVDGRYNDGRLVTNELWNVDYVIASIHYVPGVGNYPLAPDDCFLEPQELIGRWRSTLLGAVANRYVNTLAHPGRMVAAAVDLDVFFDDVLAIFQEAAKVSADNNVAWEMNELTGWRLNRHYQHQWYRIYQIALDAGVKLIYGSDAHDPNSIGMKTFTSIVLDDLPEDCLAEPETVMAGK